MNTHRIRPFDSRIKDFEVEAGTLEAAALRAAREMYGKRADRVYSLGRGYYLAIGQPGQGDGMPGNPDAIGRMFHVSLR
jgi:hypothetical protein